MCSKMNKFRKYNSGKKLIRAVKKMGLREQHKQEKLERIQAVARVLFREKGFEATTIREIAEAAQVGTGTVFLYVQDKQELLLLVFYEAIEQTIVEAFANLTGEQNLLDELVQIFGHFFQLYAQDRETASLYIKELIFQKRGQRQIEALGQIGRFMVQLGERVELAKARGEVAAGVNTGQACQNFFALYFSVLTSWLSGLADLDEAVNQSLRVALELQIRGMIL